MDAQQLQQIVQQSIATAANQAATQAAANVMQQFQAAAVPPPNLPVPQSVPLYSSKIEPDVYDGNLDSSFTEWASDFEQFAIAQNLSDVQRLAYFRRYLRGAAKSKYEELRDSAVPPQTWADWRAALILAFPAQRAMLLRREQLKCLSFPKDGSTVETYATAIRKIAKQAYPDNPAVREDQMKTQFVLGLPKEIRNRILDPGEQIPATFEEVYSRALSSELFHQRDTFGSPISFVNGTGAVQTHLYPSMTLVRTTAETPSIVNSVAQDNTNSTTNLLTDISRKLEQLMSNSVPCNWPVQGTRDSAQFNQGFRPNYSNDSNGCYTCGDPNHYRRECPKAQGTHWRDTQGRFKGASRGGRGRAGGNAHSEANLIDGGSIDEGNFWCGPNGSAKEFCGMMTTDEVIFS